MQSLKARFNGQTGEILDCVRNFGVHEAMRRYGVQDYLAMVKWIKQETGEVNYAPKFNPASNQGLLDQLVEKFAGYVARKEAQIERQDERIAELEKKLTYYQTFEVNFIESKLLSVIQACEG